MALYKPSPIDTAGIDLPKSLSELTEELARNAHDHWALLRIQEGWQWGECRNDRLKEHPDLVPYQDLSESEKQYDRNTAIETLKAIVALGYKMEQSS